MENISKIEGYELLSQKIYRVLKTEIIKGTIKPGTKLLEGKIAEQMGVSRTPIREALRELAAEGFVKMTPNQGILVNNSSIEEIQEVLQIRGVLEGLAARLAAKIIKEKEITKLKECLKRLEYFTDKNNSLAFSKLDAEFHKIILNICGNKRLIQIHEILTDQVNRYRIRSLNIQGRLERSLEEHWRIVEALEGRVPKEADRLSQAHVDSVMKNILEDEYKKRLNEGKNA